MLVIKILLILPLIATVRTQGYGVEYDGTSNVRNQGWNQRPYRPKPNLPAGRIVSAPIAAVTTTQFPVINPTQAPLQPVVPVQAPYNIPSYIPRTPPHQIIPVLQPAQPGTSAEPVTVPQPKEAASVLEPQPQPLGQPEPIPQPDSTPQKIPEPLSGQTAVPEPIPMPRPNLQSNLPTQTPIPIAQPQTNPIPETNLIPEPQTKPTLAPKPLPEPILETMPVPQPTPQPPTSHSNISPYRSGPAIALPYLPMPENKRPSAFINVPTYIPQNAWPTTRYSTPTSELPPPQPPISSFPVTTAETHPISNSVDGELEPNFDCRKGRGYYSVDRYCDSYIQCSHNIAVRRSCPDGLHFNPAANWYEYPCAYPSQVKCRTGSENQNPKPTNECPRQYGFFPAKNGDCSKYVMCQEGKGTVMDCPYGLAFNFETSSCDWPENVPSCNPNAFKDFTCPQPPLDQDGKPSDVIYKYKYGAQCKTYVACERGHPRLLSCDLGLLFDESSQSCINEDFVHNCGFTNQRA